jgi:hypothetical protein
LIYLMPVPPQNWHTVDPLPVAPHGWHLLGCVTVRMPVPPHVRHPARFEGEHEVHMTWKVVVPSCPVPWHRAHVTLW